MTMSALGGPPEEIGKKVAAALVGTFLGILLCYGFVGPLASNMAKLAAEEREYWHVLRVTMIAFMKGTSPLLATEMGRQRRPRSCPAQPSRSLRHAARNGRRTRPLRGRLQRVRLPNRLRFPDKKNIGVSTISQVIVVKRKSEPRSPPRRRLEGGVCRFCYRDDGTVHRSLADELLASRSKLRRRLLQRSHGHVEDGRHKSNRLRRKLHGHPKTTWRS